MTFLAPFALIGVLLLILPIVVHLFKPRKMKQTPFSSLRWLKQTHQRLSRRIQWHQWLLFLLRAGCLLLLVIALAKPLIGGLWSSRPTDRFIILDTSRSMAYQVPDVATPLDRATELAGKLVQNARTGDRTAVIFAGSPPRLIAPLSVDASSSLPTIQATKANQADADLSATLPLIRSLMPRRSDHDIELVFLTDNLKERWQQKEIQAFLKDSAKSVKVKIIETGGGSAYNGWIANARLFQYGPDDDRRLRVEVGCVGDSQSARSVRLTGIAGYEDDSQSITLRPGQLSRVDFRIPASLKLEGQVAELRLEPTDGLASDDVFYLALDTAWALRVLLIEPEALGPDERSVGLYLRAGMKALGAAKNQALDVETRTEATVTVNDFQKADLILMAQTPELTDPALESLEARVRGGAGLAVFLGPQFKPAFYNQKFYRFHQPAEGLLPLPFRIDGGGLVLDGKPGALTSVRWAHPLLASLQDPLLSDFTQCRFRKYGNLAGLPGKADTVLARFDDDVPAIIERPIGAGRVLVFNTSANDEWSDLPRSKSFLPLLDRTLSYLSSGGVKRSFTVGETVTLPLPEFQAKNEVSVLTPSGVKMSPRLIVQRGQTLAHLDETTEAGVYRVEVARKPSFVFTVNVPRTDSPLSPMDAKVLEEWWAPAEVEILSAESASQQLDQQSSHWPLWPLLVLFAGILLVAETIYVHRLCPRADPKAADAVVPQRGVMKPVGEKTV